MINRLRLVIAAIVIALGQLMQLLRCGLTLGIAVRRMCVRVTCCCRRAGTLLQLSHCSLTLCVAIDWLMSGRAQPTGNSGLMELLRNVVVWVRNITAPGGIMLPAGMIPRQVLPGDMVEIIHVDMDVIAVVRVAAVMIIIVMVMIVIMMMVIVIPVDIAE